MCSARDASVGLLGVIEREVSVVPCPLWGKERA